MWKPRPANSIGRGVCGAILWLVFSSQILAAVPADVNDVTQRSATVALQTAPVVIDGERLFEVGGVTAFPAERRAATIVQRIETFAQDLSVPTDSISITDLSDRTRIAAGKYEIMYVFDADAQAEGHSRHLIAEVHRQRIIEAVNDYRQARTSRALLIAGGYSLAAIVLLVVVILLLRKLFRELDALLARRYKQKLAGVRIQSFWILEAEHLWAGIRGLLRTAHTILVIAAIFLFINFVLSRFPWTRSFETRLLSALMDPLWTIGRGIVEAVPNLIFIAILVVVTRYLLKMTRLFFAAIGQGTVKLANFDREWAEPTYRIVRLLIVAFAVVVAYPYIPGSESNAFKGVSLFLGLIFSLGSSSVIGNVIAGYTMTYRRSFRIGDRVKIGAHIGDVEEVRLLITGLRGLKGERIVVPNSMILNSDIINYSQMAESKRLLLHTTVGIGYETPWRQVEAMLRLAAERTPGVLHEPPAFVLQLGLGDFCVSYELNVYFEQPHQMPQLYTVLHQNILDVFNEYGVQIMTPAYVADSAQPKIVPQEQWHLPPAPRSNGKKS